MNSEAKQFHCPNCNADLKFFPDKQKFACEYCRGEFTETELLAFMNQQQELEEQYRQDGMPPESSLTQEEQEQQRTFEEENKLYSCPSCGAEIMSDANTAASFCYYCHNPVILKGRVDGKYRPVKVLPFAFDRDKAVDTFRTWAKSKMFLPRDLLSSAQLEKLTGLYVPFWVANASTSSHVEALGENVRHWTQGNYRYTEVSQYHVVRDAGIEYEGVPADGSQKIEDQLMEAIEPFDYTQAKPFNMAYLSGFFADKYDVDKEQMLPRIKQRMFRNNQEMIDKTISYTTVRNRRQNDRVDTLNWQYMLLPVWFMTFEYKGTLWEYAVNGQSGKVAGQLPISLKKLLATCIGVGSLIAGAILGGGYLFR